MDIEGSVKNKLDGTYDEWSSVGRGKQEKNAIWWTQ
jgi:hypothetical protein